MAQREKYRLMEQNTKPKDKSTYGHIIFYKGGKNTQWRKTISSTSGAGKTGQLCVKK